jgi:hypothetical protein
LRGQTSQVGNHELAPSPRRRRVRGSPDLARSRPGVVPCDEGLAAEAARRSRPSGGCRPLHVLLRSAGERAGCQARWISPPFSPEAPPAVGNRRHPVGACGALPVGAILGGDRSLRSGRSLVAVHQHVHVVPAYGRGRHRRGDRLLRQHRVQRPLSAGRTCLTLGARTRTPLGRDGLPFALRSAMTLRSAAVQVRVGFT